MDDADRASRYEEMEREAAIRNTAKDIPPSRPGDCDMCGEWSGRLIKGVCAPCRDTYKLP